MGEGEKAANKQESWYRVWNRDRQTMEAQLKHRAAPNLIPLIDSRGRTWPIIFEGNVRARVHNIENQ